MVSRGQNRTVWSRLPEGGKLPAIGMEGDAIDLVEMALKDAHGIAAAEVPEADGLIAAAGGQELAILAEGHRVDRAGMTGKGLQNRADVGRQVALGGRKPAGFAAVHWPRTRRSVLPSG